METIPQSSLERTFVLRAYGFYTGLMERAAPSAEAGSEPGLGGKLVFVEQLDDSGRALVAAANIAGAASLSATADVQRQREAMREGIVDFVVNSLDEALRILKNEIRKKEAVSVCVALAPESLSAEMQERGVQPDIFRSELDSGNPVGPLPGTVLVEWRVPSAPAQWLPRLDTIAAECLAPSSPSQRRWLRLAPRYVGRASRSIRLVGSTPALAACFQHQVQARLEVEELTVPVQIQITGPDGSRTYEYAPRLQTR